MRVSVAAHPEAESVANEDLFGAFAGGDFFDEFDRVRNFAVDRRVAGIDNFTGCVDGLFEFDRAVDSGVVVHFEWQAERVHFFVAVPAVVFASDSHSFAQCVLRFIRQHGIHGNWNVRNAASEQPFANPFATTNRMIVHRVGMRHQPRRMCENPQTFAVGNSCQSALRLHGTVTETAPTDSCVNAFAL